MKNQPLLYVVTISAYWGYGQGTTQYAQEIFTSLNEALKYARKPRKKYKTAEIKVLYNYPESLEEKYFNPQVSLFDE